MFLAWAAGVLLSAAACTDEQLSQNVGSVQNTDFVRLHLSCGTSTAEEEDVATRAVWNDELGSGALSFKWEAVSSDSEDADKLSLSISNGSHPIPTWEGPHATSDENSSFHTGLSVSPHKNDGNRADFQTTRYYSSADLENASYCCAVVGVSQIQSNAENSSHIYHLDMPQIFTQTASQDPSFLRDYMHMYAASKYNPNGTSLNFTHIPATIRFIISNSESVSKAVEEVSVSISTMSATEGTAVASAASDVSVNWKTGTAELAYGVNSYDSVTTLLGSEGATISCGGKYIAYILVLPLEDDEAFKGKIINFNVKTGTGEYTRFQLDAERLSAANGSEVYNWVGGKSYTVKINLGSNAQVSGEIYAENSIKVSANISGTYILRYVDRNQKPLENYTEICSLTIDEINNFEDFIAENVAPREAEAIGIYDSAGERIGTIPLQQFKPSYTDPVYSFGLLSDVHCKNNDSAESVNDFQRALAFYKDLNVGLTCICGDISENGTEEEFNLYKSVTDQYSSFFPIYTTTGNHDCTGSGIHEDTWRQYTGEPIVFEKTIRHSDNSADHFLFLGMSYWNFQAPYFDHHISWLEGKLEEYRNERCFVITHLFFPDRAGNLNGIYPVNNWQKGHQLDRLQSLCDNYVNSIWFSGHSHWKWYLQKYQDRANIFRSSIADAQTSGWCVHVPSCASPIDSDGTTRERKEKESEGALINVYKDHIDVLGIDLTSGKYLPVACYRLDTELQEVAAGAIQDQHYLSASDFTWYKGTGATSVNDVEGMPNFVEVTFTATSQGYYVTNHSFVSGQSQKVSINIEEVEAFTQDMSGQWVSYPKSNLVNVGFYGKNYYMTSTNSCYVGEQGVQFQTSSSYKGSLPLKIRMKVSMQFI